MPTSAKLYPYARQGVSLWAAASVVIAVAALTGAVIGWLDLLNQIAPFWLMLSAAGLAVTLCLPADSRRLATLTAFAFSAIAHVATIEPEFTRPIPVAVEPSPDAPRVKVVWLNAQSGSAGASVQDYLLSSDANFILLSEFHAEAGMVTPALAEAYPHWNSCAEPHACNVIVLSRTAPVAARPEHERSPTDLRVVWADFDIAGAPLRLIATHLQRPYPPARYAAQRAELAALVQAGARENTILAGDFNAAPWSFALRRFTASSGLTRYDRAIATWPAASWTRLRLPAPEAFMPIDHVYAGAHWRLVSIRRGPRTGADHFPIEAEFVRREQR